MEDGGWREHLLGERQGTISGKSTLVEAEGVMRPTEQAARQEEQVLSLTGEAAILTPPSLPHNSHQCTLRKQVPFFIV